MARVGKPKILLDSGRLMAWVREKHTGTVHDAAEDVAASIRAKVPAGVEVVVNDHISAAGRPVSVPTIIHPAGLALQAKNGVCTRSAAENGLTVTRVEGG